MRTSIFGEPATRKELRAFRLPSNHVLVTARGDNPALGYTVDLEQSLIKIFPPQFAEALANLPEPKEPVADQLQRIEVQETGALIGGIVGFHHLFVKVSRILS